MYKYILYVCYTYLLRFIYSQMISCMYVLHIQIDSKDLESRDKSFLYSVSQRWLTYYLLNCRCTVITDLGLSSCTCIKTNLEAGRKYKPSPQSLTQEEFSCY